MSLKVPGRAGACTDMAERQPNHVPDPKRVPQEGDNGSLDLPPTVHERAKPPPESTLNRAVEWTRVLYERNGWLFLPLGEAGEHSPGVPTLQGEQQPYRPSNNIAVMECQIELRYISSSAILNPFLEAETDEAILERG
jgi:hypothetical protein